MNFILSRYKYWLGYLAIAFFYCRDFFFTGKVLCDASSSDEYRSYYPSVAYFVEWTRQGIIPFWNNLSMGGHPFGMHSVSIFDLYHAFSFCFGVNIGYSLAVFLGILLNGIFLYCFLRRQRISNFASFIGGLVWMIVSSRYTETGFFFLPLCLWLADFYLDSKKHVFYTAFIFSLMLYALNTNPQYLLYGCLTVMGYMFYREFLRHRFSRFEGYGRILLAFALAAGLAMIYYSRFIELVLASNRSDFYNLQMLLPTHYALAIFPNLYDCPGKPELAFIFPTVLQKIFASISALRDIQGFISVPYIGIFPMIGAVSCVFIKDKSFIVRYFLFCVGAIVVYQTLHPVFFYLIERHIPFIRGMYAIGRLLYIYLFCLSILAAMAVDYIERRTNDVWGIFLKVSGILVLGIGALLALLVALRIELYSHRDKIIQLIGQGLHFKANFVNIQAASATEFQRQRVQEFFYFFDHVISPKNPNLIWPILILAAVLIMIYFYQKGFIRSKIFQTLLVGVIAVDLLSFVGFACRSSFMSEFIRYSHIAQGVKQGRDLSRLLILEDPHTPSMRLPFFPESNMIYGIATPDGYEQLYNKRYVHFYSLLTKRKEEEITLYLLPSSDFNERLASFFNCKYILTSGFNSRLDGDARYQKLMSDAAYKVYLNIDVAPRVFVSRDFVTAGNEDEAESFLRESSGRSSQWVVIEEATPRQSQFTYDGTDMKDTVDVRRYQPNLVEIDANLKSNGYLVMSDVYYPGWKAYVDSKERPIKFANLAFRAVWIEKGKHTVKFVYQPISIKIGIFISFLALLIVAALHFKRSNTN